jgi:hypothetical protein
VDDGGDVDHGQLHDAHLVAVGGDLVADVEAGVNDDAAVVVGLLVPGDTQPRARAGVREMADDLGVELREHVAEQRPEAGGCCGGLRDPERLGVLDDDVVGGHRLTPFERSEVGFDTAESGFLVGYFLRDLRPSKPQHPAELLDRRIVSEQWADLLQCQAEVSQRQEAVEVAELGHLVGPVAARRVDLPGPEQADLVVVPQHARRHLAQPGEPSDVQHDGVMDTPSHRVKVKGPWASRFIARLR